ncbi:hypothetical protein FisN_1Hu321, partial [Fistulifera solaris]
MVLLRSQGRIAFDHVLDVLLDCANSPGLKLSLVSRGYTTLPKLLCIDYAVIDSLTYDEKPDGADDSTPVTVPVPQADRDMLKMFFKYIADRYHQGNPINDDWTSITAEEFDSFCVRGDIIGSRSGYSPAHTPRPPVYTGSPKTPMSPADAFRRGIKRDPSLFPTLKNESYNDSWHRSFVTQARAQSVSDVLDDQYVPTTDDEKELFDEKQK